MGSFPSTMAHKQPAILVTDPTLGTMKVILWGEYSQTVALAWPYSLWVNQTEDLIWQYVTENYDT